MRPFGLASVAALIVTLPFLTGGCGTRQPTDTGTHAEISGLPPEIVPTFVAHHGADEHQGPHGGLVIEIGRNHAYHAEILVEKQSGTIDVYLLDGDLNELSIEQDKITLSVSGNNQSKSTELSAVKVDGGKTFRFVAVDQHLAEALQHEKMTGKLHVTIDGRPYIGYIEARRNSGHDPRHIH